MKQQAEEDGPSQTVVSNKVLILQPTVFNGTSSQEAVAARNLGMTVEIATTTQWAAKTAADFATYRAIILGDAKCVSINAINAAVANRNVWGPMVNGNIIVVGTTPVLNSGSSITPGPLTKDAIAFALDKPDKTGLYVDLSCYYASAPTPQNPPGTPIQVLDQFGTFTALSPTGCYNTAHITGTFLATPSITDANLSNWGCSAKEVFDIYPQADFAPLVIAKDNTTGAAFPGSRTMADGTHGPVYVLAKGASPLNCGNGVLNATEECDNGAQNGVPGNACSSACRLHWCGDGIQDPSEQCDLGAGNGNTGTCSASCMTISTNRPPVALCKPAQSLPTPTNSCGVSLSIDNGSYDPDGNLLSCTQGPAGPYGLGSTTVTLTCRDTGGLTGTCSTVVSVYDNVAPRMTCPGDIVAECTNGTARVTLPAPSSASDNCSAVTVSGPGVRDFALGTTDVQYTARDVADNTSVCTDGTGAAQPIRVTVRDTLGPVITPNGFGRIQLECGTDTYTELGATATDQCYGNATSAITISGSVDPSKRGSYMITYRATDPFGNVGEGYRDVVVEDTTPPVVTLVGANPQPIECGLQPYTELGATARDNCSGDVTSLIQIDSRAVNPNSVGRYPVQYTAQDAREIKSVAIRTVAVDDNTPPSIICPAPKRAECVGGVAVVDPGPASARDACALASVSPNAPATFPIGTTSVPYTATDAAGHTVTCATDVTVSDSMPPRLDLLGSATPVLECGVDLYLEAGAIAVDACYGDITNRITVAGLVNPHAEGMYDLDYSATDPSGNLSDHVHRSVSVHDTLAPSLRLAGAPSMRLECGVDSYSESGGLAADACYGDLSSLIAIINPVNAGIEGAYTVSYSVTDPAGNSANATRGVSVEDALPPAIMLSGASTQRLECGIDNYAELGATAQDACSGNLTNSLQINASAVNSHAVGMYSVSYDVKDRHGWSAHAERNVQVSDTTAPSITCPAPTTAECVGGGAVVDPGPAWAVDACELASISPNAPAPYPLGSTSVGYTATDRAGHTDSCSTEVRVVDSQAPSIELKGELAPVLECGVSRYIEAGASSTDVCDGTLPTSISGVVDTHREGTYTLDYSARDRSGHETTAHRSVSVKDTKPPTLSLVGANPMRLECGVDSYSELGRSAEDACYGDLSNSIVINNPVNSHVEGVYTVGYSVSDPAGNSASATRSVSVEDAIPPSLTLNGAPTQRLECGVDRYMELGATAQDACSGDLTSSIQINASAVDSHSVGTYSVSYDVHDKHGWPAHAERRIDVADNTPPAISCPAPTMAECVGGGAVVDPGPALATDACALASISPHVPAAYPLGTTNVPYTATDGAGHSATCSTAVVVADTTPPQLTLQGEPALRLRCGAPYIEAGAIATDACSGDLTSQIVKSGTVDTSNPGHYAINYSVADSAGLTASATRTIEVYREPPQIVTRAPTVLPRSHTMASLHLSDCATLVTSCGGPMDINQLGHITSIYSDEPDDSRGDGHTVHDVVISGPSAFQLRGERAGPGNGRAYGVSFTVIDPSGANLGNGFCKFVVPHDNSGQAVIDDGPSAGYIAYAP